jgi:hypothetical protein
VRFNDLTQTILAVEDRTGTAAASLWRQCVDMLAQYDQAGRIMLQQSERAALVARLGDLRGELSEAQRIASVVELGSGCAPPRWWSFSRAIARRCALRRCPARVCPTRMAGAALAPRADGARRAERAQGYGAGNAPGAGGIWIRPIWCSVTRRQWYPTMLERIGALPISARMLRMRRCRKSASEAAVGEVERSQIRQLVERIERLPAVGGPFFDTARSPARWGLRRRIRGL